MQGSSSATMSLETEPVGRLLVKYSLPAIAGMIAVALYNVVDSIFIGQWVGEFALAGLAVAFPVMNLSTALGTLFGVGGASVCSIRLGEKDFSGANEALGNVCSMAMLFGIPFALITVAFLEPILVAFGASEQTMPYAYDFMLIYQLSVPVAFMFFNLAHIMRSSGYPNRSLVAMLLSVGVNIVLAPLFIKVFGWGIRGAALATLCAQLGGLIFVVRHFLSREHSVHFVRGSFFPKFRKTVLPIISIGCAPSILNICGCAIAAAFNLQMLAYGGDLAVGAYGIFSRVMIIGGMTDDGLTQGMQPIVGYNYGACRHDRVRRAFWLSMLAGVGITSLCFLACELFPQVIARAFTDNPELIADTVLGLRIGAALFAFVGGQIVINNFFQSIGRGKTAAALSTTRQMVFLLPGLFIFPHFLGKAGIWLSLPVADVASIVVTAFVFLRFLRTYKPDKVVVHPGFKTAGTDDE